MGLRNLVFGNPLRTTALDDERLNKRRALAVFSSDALSSVAYATEEILLVLVLAGSAAMSLSLPIAAVICGLIVILTVSYWQTVHAYPSGGGAFVVAKTNLGEWTGLVAAAALLIDYVLTVAVSVSAGVKAITSAFPSVVPHELLLCLISILALTWTNLRGARESAGILSLPTYGFIFVVLLLVGTGGWDMMTQTLTLLPPVNIPDTHPPAADLFTAMLILRAFSSGCAALTGIEAVSNGVPVFAKPSSRNAGITLIIMAVLLAVMFVGLTLLAVTLHIVPSETESVISQIGHAVFGNGFLYYFLQAATALILLLAANTSFAGFPRLASVLAQDGYLPRQLANLGDRLAFSNGIIALAVLASLLLLVFGAETHALVPLYSVGVFLSFTLSQAGMVVRWQRIQGTGWETKATINGVGAVTTCVALVVILESKFMAGAWIVVLLIPVLLALFKTIKKHYLVVRQELSLRSGGVGRWQRQLAAIQPKVVVPISRLHRGSLAALHFARTLSSDVTAVTVDLEDSSTATLVLAWKALKLAEPLVVLDSPYRSIVGPLMDYIAKVDHRDPERGPAVIVMPIFIPSRWWQHLIHNQTALMLKGTLMLSTMPGDKTRIIVDVPFHIRG